TPASPQALLPAAMPTAPAHAQRPDTARHIDAGSAADSRKRQDGTTAAESSADPGIAVIGKSGQFPGAASVDALWQNMIADIDPVAELPEQYLPGDRFAPGKQVGKSYCKWGGILDGRDCFDPMFFSISPREAESMNPHQRLVLQESWKAIEDAGYNPRT